MRSMLFLATAALTTLMFTGSALAEIVRCHGVAPGTKDDPYDFELSMDIVLPEPTEYDKSLTIVEGERGKFVAILGSSVGSYGVGIIEEVTTISDQRTKAKHVNKTARHQFVVTQRPSGKWSLIGFYLKDGRPIIVRADLYDPSRHFSVASTMEPLGLQTFNGRCD